MDLMDLFQPAVVKPMALSGCVALLLMLLAWWRESTARTSWPLAALGIAWVACHFAVNRLSYTFPPRMGVNWLVFGSAALVLLALAARWVKIPRPAVGNASGCILLVVCWLVLGHRGFLLHPDETSAQRTMWTAAGSTAMVITFFSAEWAARKVPPAGLLAGIAIFTAMTALGLRRMAFPDRIVVLPLAAAAAAAGAALAASLRPRAAVLTDGWAGWFCGSVYIVFVEGCLSRASNVPLWPMAGAAAGVPAAALLLALFRQVFHGGQGIAVIAALMLSGTGLFWLCARDQVRIEETPAAPQATGADDTGAYD